MTVSGADGLMKLWTLKTNECVKTFDAHEGKIWALDINKTEENIVTGAGDSNIVLWKVSGSFHLTLNKAMK